MQKFLANYATAAHLAVLAVAPLFLFPFLDGDAIAGVLLWLSLPAGAWCLLSPACRSGEMPHNARERACREMLRDPLMWFSLLAVAFAGVRALNGGVAFAYDAEAMEWSVRAPALEMFPGCVDGSGLLPFAAGVAVFVVLMGVRHALDSSSSMAFLAAASFLAGVSAVVSAIAFSYGNDMVRQMVVSSYESPSFAGTAYGVYFVGGLVALFACVEDNWRRAEPFAAFGLVCSAVGLALFSPPFTFVVFTAAFMLLLLASIPLTRGRLAGSGSLRCFIVLAMAAAAVVLLFMFDESFGALVAKKSAILDLKPLPEGFAAARDALSSIALKTWKAKPWIGSGIDSFPVYLRLYATPSDWNLVTPCQTAPLNGFWLLLAEHGILGALVVALGVGLLAWTYFSMLVRSFGGGVWHPACLLGPLTAAALVAVSLVDCSLLRPDVLLPAAAVLALSAGAFRRSSSGKDT